MSKLKGGCPTWCLTRVHCRVDLGLPKVEVRVEDLHIETEVYAETDRQLPSLFNAVRSSVEASFLACGLCIVASKFTLMHHFACRLLALVTFHL